MKEANMSEYKYSINYGNIKFCNASDGPGIRVSIYFSGCRVHCPGCHNEIAWDFNYGKKFTDITLYEIIANLKQPYYTGVSILGGEPLDSKNRKDVFHVIDEIYEKVGKSIWLWTSYTFEEILKNDIIPIETLKKIDVIVDGRFDINKKDLRLLYRGSSNQRVIDVNESLKTNTIVKIKINQEENL